MVLRATNVSVVAGRVNVDEPEIDGTDNVTLPELDPFIIKFLPADNAKFSDDVQAPVDEYQLNVLLVSPNNVIPPPLAVVSVGEPTLPISMFLSVTCNVVDSTKVVVPLTSRLPETVKLLLTVVVPVLDPKFNVVAPPAMLTNVAVSLIKLKVPLVVVIELTIEGLEFNTAVDPVPVVSSTVLPAILKRLPVAPVSNVL